MHAYTPSIDRIRDEWNRNVRMKNRKSANKESIPCNSEPWTKCEYRSIHDLLVVVDNIAKVETKWRPLSKIS